jgi:hypothetical protein
MTTVPSRETIEAVPTYLSGGDPAGRFTDYYSTWLDNLADDATVGGLASRRSRPRRAVRLAGEKLAGTPYAAYFLSGESEVPTGRGSGPAFLHTTAVMR